LWFAPLRTSNPETNDQRKEDLGVTYQYSNIDASTTIDYDDYNCNTSTLTHINQLK
jgi:hypothetical protein